MTEVLYIVIAALFCITAGIGLFLLGKRLYSMVFGYLRAEREWRRKDEEARQWRESRRLWEQRNGKGRQ